MNHFVRRIDPLKPLTVANTCLGEIEVVNAIKLPFADRHTPRVQQDL